MGGGDWGKEKKRRQCTLSLIFSDPGSDRSNSKPPHVKSKRHDKDSPSAFQPKSVLLPRDERREHHSLIVIDNHANIIHMQTFLSLAEPHMNTAIVMPGVCSPMIVFRTLFVPRGEVEENKHTKNEETKRRVVVASENNNSSRRKNKGRFRDRRNYKRYCVRYKQLTTLFLGEWDVGDSPLQKDEGWLPNHHAPQHALCRQLGIRGPLSARTLPSLQACLR